MKSTRKILFTFLIVTLVGFAGAQTNLVANSDFEKMKKRAKEMGQIDLAIGYSSPTKMKADMYISQTKSKEVGIPENKYGAEKPMKGDNYAGFVAYGYKSKMQRSYVQVEFSEKLEKEKTYCVKFHVSLSDLSKYAISDLSGYVSDEALNVDASRPLLLIEPQVKSRGNQTYHKQFYWTPVCGLYTATGNEKYLVIGNFISDEEMVTPLKVRRPRGFSKPQIYGAYYYLDNISVIATDSKRDCDCGPKTGMGKNVKVVKRNFNSDEEEEAKIISSAKTSLKKNVDGLEKSVEEANDVVAAPIEKISLIKGMRLKFEEKSFVVSKTMTAKMDALIALLKKKPELPITLQGSVSSSEMEIEKLDIRRIGMVYKYIVSKGIAKERLKRKKFSASDPKADTEEEDRCVKIIFESATK